MPPSSKSPRAAKLAVLLGLATPGCVTDSVPPDIYSEASQPDADPSVEAPSDRTARDEPPTRPANAPGTAATGSEPEAPGIAPAADPEADAVAPVAGNGSGACDLRGHWLITQHTIASGLGVKQRAAWWFYYEIDQAGSDLTVKRGFVCGSQVFPVDPLSAAVEFDASFPAMLANNSHAGRRGSVTASGDGCSVSFERAVIVVGATTPFYADERNALPTIEQPATDTEPGWEDWDEDGNPAVSLHVSGLVEGERYTALRSFILWSGSIPSGAMTFRLPVSDWGQEESVLGVTAEVLKQTGVPDADRSGHFTQFARLAPEQVPGDPDSICATVRQLAPTLTPDANR
jgi:hypothetical protein